MALTSKSDVTISLSVPTGKSQPTDAGESWFAHLPAYSFSSLLLNDVVIVL